MSEHELSPDEFTAEVKSAEAREHALAEANESGRWVGVGEAVARLGVAPRVVEQWIADGDLVGGQDDAGRLVVAASESRRLATTRPSRHPESRPRARLQKQR